MEPLKNLTILIGKEPNGPRLLLAVTANGQTRTAFVAEAEAVPATVSRCIAADGKAHCRLEADARGVLTLTNLKPQNVTAVNGMPIVTKRITAESRVTLGKDGFVLPIAAVLATAQQTVAATTKAQADKLQPADGHTQPAFSIRPLKAVWEEYKMQERTLKERQRKLNLLARVPLAFTMIGGLLSIVAPEIRIYTIILTGVALIITIYGLYTQYTDKSLKQTEDLTEWLQTHYLCPNPACHHFVGHKSYTVLQQDTACPYCRCRYTK